LLIRSHGIKAAPTVKNFFPLFAPELRVRNRHQSTLFRAAVKNIL
jgi:hypothetical protein